mgnify:CR=1 FL=1
MQRGLLALSATARCMDYIREKSCPGRNDLLVMLLANLTSLEAGAEALLQVGWACPLPASDVAISPVDACTAMHARAACWGTAAWGATHACDMIGSLPVSCELRMLHADGPGPS